MTEGEFLEGVEIVENALQAAMDSVFRVSVLWPCFRKENADRWMRCCEGVARSAFNTRALVLKDFHVAMDRAATGSTDDSIQRAKERRATREAEKKAAGASWKRTPRAILEEKAAEGDAFAVEQLRLMDRRQSQKG